MTFSIGRGPQRIVCLTDETTELLYALGQDARVVGISAYCRRPARAQKEKPVVCAFSHGSVDRIRACKPDLVLGFSDVQAQLAKDLIAAGLPVFVFNQRSVQEILDFVMTLGQLVGQAESARTLVGGYLRHIDQVQSQAAGLSRRPRVYFEEWDDPIITGIRWVHELIEIAGGEDIFAELAACSLASERVVQPRDVCARNPELVLASWCGKPFRPASFVARPGFSDLVAVQRGDLVEVPGEIILQPGPASLTEGLSFVAEHVRRVVES